ncbi:hypothetical protein Airi02_030800 [Actinoallomurus iriomotensis]|uniref:Uncharacterized protein n=1 Tax=Actinoallomurus iriomotensis TaxID=478107 RepID=A0A9W6RYK4_9ACTN|nr:hypothetical protein Airi02_030800 [Actinoallomurus iriomotensis]
MGRGSSDSGREPVDRAEAEAFDVVDGFVEQGGDVVVVEAVDDAASLPVAGDEARGGAGGGGWCETAERSMPTASASSPTGQGPWRSRAMMSSRLAVAFHGRYGLNILLHFVGGNVISHVSGDAFRPPPAARRVRASVPSWR